MMNGISESEKGKPKPSVFRRILSFITILTLFSALGVPVLGAMPELAPEHQKTLRVGFEGMTVPCSWVQSDASGGAVPIAGTEQFINGFEVAYMKKVCQLAGYQMEAYKYDWDGLMMAVSSGKIDCAVNMISPTEDRRQTMDFTVPYYYADTVAVVLKNGPYAEAEKIGDLTGARATSMLNTMWYSQTDRIPQVKKTPAMENVPAMVVALQSDKVDVILLDRPTAEGILAANSGLTIAPMPGIGNFNETREETAVSIALPRGSEEILADLNNAIAQISQEELETMIAEASQHQPMEKSEQDVAALSFFSMVGLLLREYGAVFLQGAALSLMLAFFGTLLGTMIGCLTGAAAAFPLDEEGNLFKRISLRVIQAIVSFYVWLFRGTPMMVQAMVIYYGAAQLLGWNMNPLLAGLFIISVNTGAYMTETVRGGILCVDKGQLEGAKAIGMNTFQSMFRIILPQGFRSMIPQIGNYLISNIKDTSLLSVITVGELFYRAREAAGQYFRFFEVFLIVSLIYLFLTTVVTYLLKRIENKINKTGNYQLQETAYKENAI